MKRLINRAKDKIADFHIPEHMKNSENPLDWRNDRIDVQISKAVSNDPAKEVEAAVALVRRNEALSLDVSGTQHSADDLSRMAAAMLLNHVITEVNLNDCALCIQPDSADHTGMRYNTAALRDFMLSLKHHSVLQKVQMAGNSMGPSGLLMVATLFFQTKVADKEMVNRKVLPKALQPDPRLPGKKIEINLTSFHTLNLARNQLLGEGGKTIAACIKQKHFYITDLNLASNGLGYEGGVAIAEALAANGSIQILDMRHNNIVREGARILGKAVATRRKGKWTMFNGVSLSTITKGGDVEMFDLSKTNCGPAGGYAMAMWLSKSRLKPEILNLKDARINPVGCESLLASLHYDPETATGPAQINWWAYLRVLDLSGENNIGMVNARAMGPSTMHAPLLEKIILNKKIETPVLPLRKHEVSHHDFSEGSYTPEDMVLFISVLAHNNIMDERTIIANKLERFESVKLMCKSNFSVNAVRTNNISILNFSHTRLREADMTLIFELLCLNTSVETLDLSGSNLSPQSVEALIHMMDQTQSIHNATLETLIHTPVQSHLKQIIPVGALRRNECKQLKMRLMGVGPLDLKLLTTLIKPTTCIELLDLSSNSLCGVVLSKTTGKPIGTRDHTGLQLLADVLYDYKGLTSLSLTANFLGNEGMDIIAGVFERNLHMQTELVDLFLDDNGITKPPMKQLGMLKRLEHLVIKRGNDLGDPLPPWMRNENELKLRKYLQNFAMGIQERRKVLLVMAGLLPMGMLPRLFHNMYEPDDISLMPSPAASPIPFGRSSQSPSPPVEAPTLMQWDVRETVPVSIMTRDFSGHIPKSMAGHLLGMKKMSVTVLVWKVLPMLPLQSYEDVRCSMCNKLLEGNDFVDLAMPKEPAYRGREPYPSSNDKETNKPYLPFHVRCIHRHPLLDDVIHQWTDAMRMFLPGVKCFMIAVYDNDSLLDPGTMKAIRLERKECDRMMEAESKLMLAQVLERQRRDDSKGIQLGWADKEHERGAPSESATLLNAKLQKREHNIHQDREAFQATLAEARDNLRQEHNEGLAKLRENHAGQSAVLSHERMMQDNAITREREQCDKQVEMHCKAERTCYDELYWDQVASLARNLYTTNEHDNKAKDILLQDRAKGAVERLREKNLEEMLKSKAERAKRVKRDRAIEDEFPYKEGLRIVKDQVNQVRTGMSDKRRERKLREGLSTNVLAMAHDSVSYLVNTSTGEGIEEIVSHLEAEAIRLAVEPPAPINSIDQVAKQALAEKSDNMSATSSQHNQNSEHELNMEPSMTSLQESGRNSPREDISRRNSTSSRAEGS